ncbi:pneumococcal-type histidine triad protein [Hutsoniella sourekii]
MHKFKHLNPKFLSRAALATLLAVGALPVLPSVLAESSSQYSVNYIEGADEDSAKQSQSTEKMRDAQGKSQEEINQAEGIAAEQIVVTISEEGYVTSHGDHYHYYNGQVPHESFISESLLTDKNYTYQEADKVSDLADGGQVVKVNDEYRVYYQDPSQANNLRTVEELVLQSHGIHPEDAANIVKLQEELELSEASMIKYETEKDIDQILKAAKIDRPATVVYLTEKEAVYLIGIDLYVIPGKVKADAKFSERLLAPSDYQLNKDDILQDIEGGHIVKIGKHCYVYLFDSKQKDNIVSSDTIKHEAKKAYQAIEASGELADRQAKKEEAAAGAVLGAGTRDGSGRLVADDGYVFSPYDVIRDAGSGFIVPHGDHFHFIPKAQLTAAELEIAYQVLGGGSSATNQTNAVANTAHKEGQSGSHLSGQAGPSGRYHAKGSYTTDDGYVFTVESIVSADGSGLVTAHHDHFHYVPFADLSKQELQATQDYLKRQFGINRNLVQEYAPTRQNRPEPKPAPIQPSDQAKKPDTSNQKPASPNEKPSALQEALNKLYQLPDSKRHVEGDGLVFDPMTITKVVSIKGEKAYVIPHGDHFHTIKDSQLSELERQVTQMVIQEKGLDSHSKSEKNQPAKPEAKDEGKQTDKKETDQASDSQAQVNPKQKVDFLSLNINKLPKGKDGKVYTTSDGYRFSPESILSYDQEGLVAQHGDHTHYIPLAELEDSELKAASDYINQSQDKVKTTKPAQGTPEQIQQKLNYVAALVGLSKDQLKLTGNLVIIPHGDHTHTMDLDEVPLVLRADQFPDAEAYQNHLIALKINQAKLEAPDSQVIRDGDQIVLVDPSGKEKRIPLADQKLPFDYQEADFQNLKRPEKSKQEIEKEKQREEEAKKAAQEAEAKAQREKEQPTVQSMKDFLAGHYRVAVDQIQFFSDLFMISNPSGDPDAENISIHRDQVALAMKGDLNVLPPIPASPSPSLHEEVIDSTIPEVTDTPAPEATESVLQDASTPAGSEEINEAATEDNELLTQ